MTAASNDLSDRRPPTDQQPDTSNQTHILVWMCVLVAINQLGFGAMVPTLPLYAQSFGVTASAIGMAIAAYGLARFVVALPAGGLADAIGRRPTLAIGGLVSGLGNLWCAAAISYPEFLLARFVAGAGAGLIVTAGHVVLADISSPERRGRMISIYMGTFIFAVGIGPFPGGLLAEYYGLDAPFVAYGIASLVAMLIAWFAIEETRDLQRRPAKSPQPRLSFLNQINVLCGHIGFLMASLVTFVNAVVRTGGLFAIVPVLATSQLGLSVSEIGLALMIGSVSGLITAYPAGWFTDRIGRKVVIVPATLLTGVSMLAFCFAPSFAWFLLAAIVWGIASTVGGSIPAAYAADSAPRGMNASAMSTYRMMGDAGYVIGPIALGLLADSVGMAPSLVIAAMMMFGVGAAFAVFAPETYRGYSRPSS
jgi:MFS family permease